MGAFQHSARSRYHKIKRLDLIGNSAVTIRDYGTIVRKRKLVLELTRSTATRPKKGSNNDARIITEQIMVLLYKSVSSYWS